MGRKVFYFLEHRWFRVIYLHSARSRIEIGSGDALLLEVTHMTFNLAPS